jgi:Na+-driven multidrug efflux pump
MSVVSILYNFLLMRLAGQQGIAAYGAVMYVSFALVAVFLGYSLGTIPVVGFHFGAQDHRELKSLFRKSNVLVMSASVLLSLSAFLLARPLASLFVGRDPATLEMTVRAFRFYALSVLFSGFSIFGSAFFTALNNGIVSALISFLRTFAFQAVAVVVLPLIFGLDGIWYALFVSEVFAMAVTGYFYRAKRSTYHY